MPDASARYLTVPYGGNFLTMTLPAARQLQEALSREIAVAECDPTRPAPPHVDTDGYMSRVDFMDFFGQFYRASTLNRRTSKLYASIIRLAAGMFYGEKIDFDVVCVRCGQHVSKECTVPDNPHFYVGETNVFRIGTVSLAEHLEEYVAGDWHLIGSALKEDLRVLVTNLP